MGKAMGTLIQLGGPGITITEQVYRKLPSDARGPWTKRTGHVVYFQP
mgnify:CR=1|jgi:hypothetical protein|tara:strand:- start:245 stop:385 length:141 start_codon:yes stop_codon:yes gene_type:complete